MRTAERDSERGATAVEYAVMAALIAVIIFGTVQLIGLELREVFQDERLEEALTP